jgi:hypothetical protein
MEKVCESLAPTFEKFASFNELKVAQKETENYVKSIKKFNVRTKINQEYSERILKLEKSIEFLERMNDKSNRMFKTPIIEEAKRRNSLRVFDNETTNNSTTTNSALVTPKKVAVELEVPRIEEKVVPAGKIEDTPIAPASPARQPPSFQERILKPSWVKTEEPAVTTEVQSAEKPKFQERVIKPSASSWIKPKEEVTPVVNTIEVKEEVVKTENVSSKEEAESKASVVALDVVPPMDAKNTVSSDSTNTIASIDIDKSVPIIPEAIAGPSTSVEVDVVASQAQNSEAKADHLNSVAQTTVTTTKIITNTTTSTKEEQQSQAVVSDNKPSWKKQLEERKAGNANNDSIKTSSPLPIVEKKLTTRASWIKPKEELEKEVPIVLPAPLPVPPPAPVPASPVVQAKVQPTTPIPATEVIKIQRDNSAKELLARSTSSNLSENSTPNRFPKAFPKSGSQSTEKINAGESPSSTVVKSIVSQINSTKTMNASFYEKKLQVESTSTSGYNPSNKPFDLNEKLDDWNIPELKQDEKKGWRDIVQPLYVPILTPVEEKTTETRKLSPNTGRSPRSNNFQGYGLHSIENENSMDSVELPGGTLSSSSKPKSWRELSASRSGFEPKPEVKKTIEELKALEPVTPPQPAKQPVVNRFQPKLAGPVTETKVEIKPEPPKVEPARSAPSPNAPPRITGSRGLASAIALRKNSMSSNSSAESIPQQYGSVESGNSSNAPRKEITYNSVADIPTRQNMSFPNKASSPVNAPSPVSSLTKKQSRMMQVEEEKEDRPPIKEFEMDVPMVIVTNSPVRQSAEADNKFETGSATSALTMDSKLSSSSKKSRPSVKGFVKRVNSLFKTKTSEKLVSDDPSVISEKNLTRANLSFVQEKKQSFIEKKIDDNTKIVTSTPVIKPAEDEFDFIDHIDDDVSSIEEEQKAPVPPPAPQQASPQQASQAQASTVSSLSGTGSSEKAEKTMSKRISGLIRKTSSMFKGFVSAPEPPPRPENLPPVSSATATTKALKPGDKKVTGIAIGASDSFEVPAMSNNSNKVAQSASVQNSLQYSDRGVPVEAASIGTVDQMIQQQNDAEGEEGEEVSVDKFDGTSKPRKFKPVKFLKKTFTSMSKMI